MLVMDRLGIGGSFAEFHYIDFIEDFVLVGHDGPHNISTYDGKFKFVIAEGQSVKGAIPPTGNTNTRVHFKPDVRSFLYKWMAEGPTHHFALGIGKHAQSIAKIANYLNIEAVIVTGE